MGKEISPFHICDFHQTWQAQASRNWSKTTRFPSLLPFMPIPARLGIVCGALISPETSQAPGISSLRSPGEVQSFPFVPACSHGVFNAQPAFPARRRPGCEPLLFSSV